MHRSIERHDALLSAEILVRGGTILTDRGEGDSIFAVFARAREAVAAALAAQRALVAEPWSEGPVLRARMAVHSGEVGHDYRGLDVNRCARLRGLANGGQILISSTTAELVRRYLPEGAALVDLGMHQLRDLPGPERVFQLQHPDLPSGLRPLKPSAAALDRLDLPAVSAGIIGRDEELQRLTELLQQGAHGKGRLILISGEPGIGKTRLVDECASLARRFGVRTLMAHCYEEEGLAPYQPLVQLLSGALHTMPPQELAEALGEAASELAKVMPELKLVFPSIPEPLDLPPEQARSYFFRTVCEFIERVSMRVPLLLIIDDLHWADAPTLLLLQHLASVVRELPALLVTTYRDVEPDANPSLAHAIEEMIRRSRPARIRLRPLGTAAVAALLAAFSGREPPKAVVELMETQSDGNPFFLEEIYRQLAEERSLFDASGNWRSAPALDVTNVPQSVRLIVGRRLERLTESAHRLLELQAVIGRTSSFSLLQEASSADPDTLLEALDETEKANLLTVSDAGRDVTISFRHELIRQTFLSRLTLPRRLRLHEQIAEALERFHGSAVEEHAAEIAYHLYQAGRAGDPLKTVRYLTLAALKAFRATAFEDALTHLDHALELSPPDDLHTRAQLLHQYGRALRSLKRWEPAMEAWTEALRLLESMGEDKVMAELCADMAIQLAWSARTEESVQTAARGLGLAGNDASEARALMLTVLAGPVSFSGNHDSAVNLLQDASEIASALGDPHLKAFILGYEALTDFLWSRPAACVLQGTSAAEQLKATNDPFFAVNMLAFVELSLCLMARLDDSAHVGEEVHELSDRYGHLGAERMHRTAELLRAMAAGEVEQLESLSHQNLVWCEQHQQPWLSDAVTATGVAALWRGDWQVALARFETAVPIAPEGVLAGTPWAFKFLTLAYAGEHDRVRRLALERLPRLPQSGEPIGIGDLAIIRAMVEGLPMVRMSEEAGALYPLAVDLLAAGSVCSSDLCLMESIAGRAAVMAGYWERAKAHFTRALRQADEMPHRIGYAEVRRLYAWSLLERGDARERQAALALLEEASDRYSMLGMLRHADMARLMRSQA